MNKNLQKTLELVPHYIYQYGLFNALKLTFKFITGTAKIRLKGIRYPINVRKRSSDIPAFHSIFAFKEYDLKMVNRRPQ